MSCQQASRIISTSSSTISAVAIPNTPTLDDPYVFTETAPTTPPILFNNSQKSRNRFIATQTANVAAGTVAAATAATTTSTTVAANTPPPPPITHATTKQLSLGKLKSNGRKTQTTTPFALKGGVFTTATTTATTTVPPSSTATNITAVLGVLNTNNVKYGPQSPKQQQQQLQTNQLKHTQHVLLAQNENAAAVAAPVTAATAANINRNLPQQQTVLQQKQQQQQLQQKFPAPPQPPPPLLLSHTPSLWQTPLLLESPNTAIAIEKSSDTTTVATAAATLPSKPVPLKTSLQPPTLTPLPTLAATALVTPITLPKTATTPTANIAPILIVPTATTLPPSNFHHTTLAQHLQKVECIKKPKKSAPLPLAAASVALPRLANATTSITTPPAKSLPPQTSTQSSSTALPTPPAAAPAAAPKILTPTQHSANDLNEIPVNVIFRSPPKNKNIACTVIQDVAAGLSTDTSDITNLKAHDANAPAVGAATAAQLIHSTSAAVTLATPKIPTKKSSKTTNRRKNNNNNNNTSNILDQQQTKSRKSQKVVIKSLPVPKLEYRNTSNDLLPNTTTTPTPPTARIISVTTTSNPTLLPAVLVPFATVNEKKTVKSEKAASKRKISANNGQKPQKSKRKLVYPAKVATENSAATTKIVPAAATATIPAISNVTSVQTTTSAEATIRSATSTTKAVAIVKLCHNADDVDAMLLGDDSEMPYYLMRHWFDVHEKGNASTSSGREDRITAHKELLQRQALQLLATRSLQQLPIRVAKKRLICVDALLRKYQDHSRAITDTINKSQCEVETCTNSALEASKYCSQHIMRHPKQYLFVPCSAKNDLDSSKPCEMPALNIQKAQRPPLCHVHAAQRLIADNATATLGGNAVAVVAQPNDKRTSNGTKSAVARKRKATAISIDDVPCVKIPPNTLATSITATSESLPLRSNIGLQRKNSTTSLESIASNSHSSFGSSILPTPTSVVALHAYQQQQQQQQQNNNNNIFPANMLSPPALAPLSYHTSFSPEINQMLSSRRQQQQEQQHQHQQQQQLQLQRSFNGITTDAAAEHEINKLVAQIAMAAAASTNNNCFNNVNNNHHNNNNNNMHNNNNNNSFTYMNTNSNSNLTSSGIGSSSSLPSTDELLTQDMLSICENSSAYASSSEDTGLGELSESELIAASGASDELVVNGCIAGGGGGGGLNVDDDVADGIPLGDARLLEENDDLVNVFGSLPVNLNEIFTTVVRQDERDEVERALELADKHLKTLQETIGSDSDFLADFLNDDMLADADDICSKMEIVSSVLPSSEHLDNANLYLENAESIIGGAGGGISVGGSGGSSIGIGNLHHHHHHSNAAVTGNYAAGHAAGGAAAVAALDTRGLLQT